MSLIAPEARYAPIARPSGAFAMVALDQRESLRGLFADAGVRDATDAMLVDFKGEAARTLAAAASAVLVDRIYGDQVFRAAASFPPTCALAVSVDRLVQEPGGPVTDTELDEHAFAVAGERGAAAAKLLVMWRGENAERCLALSRRFVARCRELGLLAVLEAIVRPPGGDAAWDREQALVEAARALGALAPDVYKAEVPLHGRGALPELVRRCEQVSAVVPCPWVVLSNGVERERFPAAVEAACRGGASGFLAGRAIWSDAVGAGDYAARLRERSLARLERLCEIVDRHARPYRDAAAR